MSPQEEEVPVSEEAKETTAPDEPGASKTPDRDASSEDDDGASGDDEAEFEFRRDDEFPDSPRRPFGGPPRRWDRF
ncbi:MAG: hypothetical protein R3195_06450 [Gemmatimonadota bacterium]|nr:hypothetical protein [Gemmatimonadota bacterium]